MLVTPGKVTMTAHQAVCSRIISQLQERKDTVQAKAQVFN